MIKTIKASIGKSKVFSISMVEPYTQCKERGASLSLF